MREARLAPPQVVFSNREKDYDDKEGLKMANAATKIEIDWMACELIESVPGKVSGRPVVRGTRILPDAIVGSYDLGETIDELREGFPALSVHQIKRLIEFAHAQRGQAGQ
jgi:uncharacterized protein (DUF433 family)